MDDFWLKYIDNNRSTTPKNKDGVPHGHWIAYDKKDEFWFECNYVNGKELGHEKWANGEIFYHAI